MKNRYNKERVILTGPPKLLRPEYGHWDEESQTMVPDFPKEDEIRDNDGFDKRFATPNGSYKQRIALPSGTRLCRYGSPTGGYTADCGAPYNKLGLPYDEGSCEYHEYIVEKDDSCYVTYGLVAPAFNSDGGVIQY